MDNNLPASEVPQATITTSQPQLSPKNTWKYIALGLIGIVIIVSTGLGGFYFGAKSKTPSLSNTDKPKNLLHPSPTIDPTANWQTYTNTAYGFSVKYSPQLNAIENTTKYVRFTTDKPNSNLPNSESYISILVMDNPDSLSLDNWIKANRNNATQTTLHGITAYTTTPQVNNPDTMYYIENNGNVLQIALILMGGDNGLSTLFMQMLPTFQFTSPTAHPNWQTYSGNGFTFEYPKTWIHPEEMLPNSPYVYFVDPTSGSHTGNGGGLIYGDFIQANFTQSSQEIQAFIDDKKAKEIPALQSDFQSKTITLNGKQTEVYHQGGEGTVGWYIPFSNGKMIVTFGPLSTDPSEDSVELQIVKTFAFE